MYQQQYSQYPQQQQYSQYPQQYQQQYKPPSFQPSSPSFQQPSFQPSSLSFQQPSSPSFQQPSFQPPPAAAQPSFQPAAAAAAQPSFQSSQLPPAPFQSPPPQGQNAGNSPHFPPPPPSQSQSQSKPSVSSTPLQFKSSSGSFKAPKLQQSQIFTPSPIDKSQKTLKLEKEEQTDGPLWDPRLNTWYKKDNAGEKMRYNKEKDLSKEKREKITSHKGIDSIENIFPNDYKPPETILTAIKKISKDTPKSSGGDAEKTIDPLKVTQACNLILYNSIAIRQGLIPENYPNMTIEEAKTVASYTYNGNGDNEMSPFQEVNNILRRGNPDEIRGSIDMIYMLLKSFRKIKPEQHKILYRGVKAELVGKKVRLYNGAPFQPDVEYNKGTIVTFDQLTSTSLKRSVAVSFLDTKRKGVIFRIHGGEGYNVAPFSMFASEREIVMDIQSIFEVSGVSEEEVWDYNAIFKEENEGKEDEQTSNKIVKFKLNVIDLEYKKPDRLPFQDHIDRMDAYIQKEGDKTIPMIDAYKTSKAPHAEGRPEDEFTTRSTNAGRAIKLNMRTGEIRDVGSTVGLPKGWVEMTEEIEGVEITYYTDGKVKQYERPQVK